MTEDEKDERMMLAAVALAGLTFQAGKEGRPRDMTWGGYVKTVAGIAFDYADAMLAERKKRDAQ
jgi:hypothetical protein